MPRIVPLRLSTARLTLEPLSVAHAAEISIALADPALYDFIGGEPPTTEALEARYARLESHSSPDGAEAWLNWALRARDDATLAGYVQATVSDASVGPEADLAWVVATERQGEGIATEASDAVVTWLRERGVVRFRASIHPEHAASAAVARRLGLRPTAEEIDGEVVWTDDAEG